MNQPPQTETQTAKRIVSKGEYGARKVLALSLSGGVGLCGGGVMLLLMRYIHTTILDRNGRSTPDETFLHFDPATVAFVCLSPILLFAGFGLWWGSRKSWNTVRAMQPIQYANTADLPALDTLVRASSEPVQEQQAVLLRAATESVERHEEQLVRAATGGGEQI